MATIPESVDATPIVNEWCELRDAQGKLYARLHARDWLLEIKRNDRDAIARFNLREFLLLAALDAQGTMLE